ncbi:MAG: substrate-binding domain-containing protein [Bifidobacteriaceae bacterium]|nr:substrate-binding domain-containing protein [Bifidobacteriaceae bacterium]
MFIDLAFLGALMAALVIPLGLVAALITAVAVVKKPQAKRIWATVLCFTVWVGSWIVFGLVALMVSGRAASYVGVFGLGGLGLLVIALILVWRPFQRRPRLVTVGVIGGLVVALVAGTAVRDYHRANLLVVGDKDLQVDLQLYEPFVDGTLAASLDQPSTLSLEGWLPRMDGATALYPLYASFARATYPVGDYPTGHPGPQPTPAFDWQYFPEGSPPSEVACSTTSYAFTNLLLGEVDVAFLMGLSESQRQEAADLGVELELTPIGREAFVFFVNQRNSVSNLSADQVRQIYSGQIANWRDVGGSWSEIEAYQRNENSGSQTAFEEVMGDTPIMAPPRDREYTSMSGVAAQVLDYRNSRGAIGFSFRYYLEQMILSDAIKMLSIDGYAPTPENIASGDYPFTIDFYAVTVKGYNADAAEAWWGDAGADAQSRAHPSAEDQERARQATRLVDWITSAQGQELVEKVGYVPLRER